MTSQIRYVDPRTLRVPTSQTYGADPAKLQRQIAQFGRSAVGMPAIWVYEGSDGILLIYNGVTRATRIAKLVPGTLVPVDIIGHIGRSFAALPSIEELLP